MEDGVLVERGRDAPYLEHWRRDPARAVEPAEAFWLRDEADGRAGCLVRAGADFMYARDRSRALPRHGELIDHVARSPSLEAAQDLVDLELSKGSVAGAGVWRIARSSLPYREGLDLAVEIDAAAGAVTIADQRPDGRALRRSWRIEARHPPSSPDRKPA